jgi:predicted DNA-binding transcriptional regulator YafY
MARFDRVLELSAQLQRTREPQSLESLMAHMGVSRATLNRLIGVLRNEAGFDVQYVKEQGYVLQRSPRDTLATKLLELNSADVANLLVAEALLDQLTPGLLRDETASLRKALEKLNAKRLGDADMRRRLQLRLNHLRPTSQKGFNVLLNALLTQRQVSFDYHSRNEDRSSRRLCSPQRLTFYRNNWYLSAWCHERDALRLFSVDRISEPRLSRDDAQQVDERSLTQQLDASYGIYPGPATETAVLQFSAKSARWVAEEQWHPNARYETMPDGGVTLHVPYHHDTELIMEILRHGDQCEVLAPASLRTAVTDALRKAVSRYSKR